MNKEKGKLLRSLTFPLIFLMLMWLVKIFEIISGIDLSFLGVYPLSAKGLIGIITSPLIHGNFSHLIANSVPILILGASIFYFYRKIAYKVFFLVYLFAGVWLWFFARGQSYHIGASGLIYGMGSFLFLSGIIRRDAGLMAVSLVVIFVYGSMIWGIFPDFFPDRRISWQGHLTGLLAGVILAIYFKNSGPQRKKYSWELEEEEEETDDIISSEEGGENNNNDSVEIKYHYKTKKEN